MTTKQRTTVSKTNNADGNPPPPRKGETNRTTQRPEGRDLTSGTLQTPNLQTPKPTRTTTTTKNTKNKPYLQTPIKPRSTHKTAERLQTMTPNKKHHNTKRGTHIKIGKLTANQTTKKRTKHQKGENQMTCKNRQCEYQPPAPQRQLTQKRSNKEIRYARLWAEIELPKLLGHKPQSENKTHEGDPFARTPSEIRARMERGKESAAA